MKTRLTAFVVWLSVISGVAWAAPPLAQTVPPQATSPQTATPQAGLKTLTAPASSLRDRVLRSLAAVGDGLGRQRLGELIESDVILAGVDAETGIAALENILALTPVSAVKTQAIEDVIDRLRRLARTMDRPTGQTNGRGSLFAPLPPAGLASGASDYKR